MLSYWEKTSFLHYDVLVIGSGIVGLSTAISLKEKDPKLHIAILERGILPTGASTKNAGFACIGSLTEILDDLKHIPEAEVLQLVSLRRNGLAKLRKRLGDETIAYRENGSHELIFEKELDALNQLDKINDLLRPMLNVDAFSLANERIADFGFAGVKALVKNNCEGELNTGRMMRTLIALAMQKGIQIISGCEVELIEETATGVSVFAKHGHLNELIPFSPRKVAVCTNAFAKTFLPGEDIAPGRGQVMITKPIPGLQVKGIFHFDEGYYYFREIDGRVLFGGGRNKDKQMENSTAFEYNELILNDLHEKLSSIILPNTAFEIDYAWTGIMAFGKNKFPIIRQASANVFAGVRMGGMGVAIGSEVGEQLAGLISEFI